MDEARVGPGGAAHIEERSVRGQAAADRQPHELSKPSFPGCSHEPIPRIWIPRRTLPVGGKRAEHLERAPHHPEDSNPPRQVGLRPIRKPPIRCSGEVPQPGQGRKRSPSGEPGQRPAHIHMRMAGPHVASVGKAPSKPLGDRGARRLRVVGESDVVFEAVEHARPATTGPAPVDRLSAARGYEPRLSREPA